MNIFSFGLGVISSIYELPATDYALALINRVKEIKALLKTVLNKP
jgi:hypothetical protein